VVSDVEKIDLLTELTDKAGAPINLNVAPVRRAHPKRGISLAWLLANQNKWDLLEKLADQYSSR